MMHQYMTFHTEFFFDNYLVHTDRLQNSEKYIKGVIRISQPLHTVDIRDPLTPFDFQDTKYVKQAGTELCQIADDVAGSGWWGVGGGWVIGG